MTHHSPSIGIFRRLFPRYRHRWEVYNECLLHHLSKETTWLDIGCGANEYVADFGNSAGSAIGVDVVEHSNRAGAPFLRADLRGIPLPDQVANLITMRMVVEHLERIPGDFTDIIRLLAPGGRLIILTTNVLSPMVFLPGLLPFRLKRLLIRRLFGVHDEDVFPTYHRFNSPSRIKSGLTGLKLSSLDFIEEVPLDSFILTLTFGLWYSLVRFGPFRQFRSSLLAVFEKLPAERQPYAGSRGLVEAPSNESRHLPE